LILVFLPFLFCLENLIKMKVSPLALLSLAGLAAANRPQLSVNVQGGNFAGVEGLEPTITWEGSSAAGDIDLSYGVDVAAQPTKDIASLPRSVWGKASTSVSGWLASVRAEIDAQSPDSVSVEINADNEENDLSIKVAGSASQSNVNVASVEATKLFEMDKATVSVNPRYNLDTEEADVIIGYVADKTEVEVTASKDSQSVTLSQQVDDENRVAPTLTSAGAIALEWERSLGDDGSVTTTLKPNEAIDIEWKDDAWTANINLPIEGTEVKGANVNIKREVTF